MARLQRSCGTQTGTGCHEDGIILSKKPPEWFLSPSGFLINLRCQRPVKTYFRNILIIFSLDFVYG